MPDMARWNIRLEFMTRHPPSNSWVLLFLTEITLIWGISCFSFRQLISVMSLLSRCSYCSLSKISRGTTPWMALLLSWIISICGRRHSVSGIKLMMLLLERSICLSCGKHNIGRSVIILPLRLSDERLGNWHDYSNVIFENLLKPATNFYNVLKENLGSWPSRQFADKSISQMLSITLN
jgi:hypothetical protein